MDEVPFETSCTEVKARLDAGEELLLIDCRGPDEHAIVNLPSARLIPMDETPARLGDLVAAGDTPIVVYCHHGMRSARVAEWLRSSGVPHAQSMAGGIDAWAKEIDPSLPRY